MLLVIDVTIVGPFVLDNGLSDHLFWNTFEVPNPSLINLSQFLVLKQEIQPEARCVLLNICTNWSSQCIFLARTLQSGESCKINQ